MNEKHYFRFLMAFAVGIFVSLNVLAQDITVKGSVKDTYGEPVMMGTVQQKGTSKGCMTDLEGNFTLTVPKGATLVFSYMGFVTQELPAQPTMTVIMEEDVKMLEETVVIGYATVKKNDLTGSVIAIRPDEMNHGLQTNPQDMIQGKIAGVSVIPGDGTPGGGATIRIRGGSSLNASNNPLIVIDGLALDAHENEGQGNPLTMINPADIESFTVLKDASATAIYGSRASNGVIIITTKKGLANSKPRVSYNGNVSFSVNTKKLDVLSSSRYQKFTQNLFGYKDNDEGWKASSQYQNLGYYDADGTHRFANTDWQKEIYRTAWNTDHNVTVAGGIKNMPYRVSLGYTHQDGTLKTSNFNRYTASVNLSPSLFDDHLKVNMNAKLMFSRYSYANTSAVGKAIYADPTKPVYDKTGSLASQQYGGFWQWPVTSDFDDSEWQYSYSGLNADNPVAALLNQKNIGKSRDFLGNVEMDYKIHGFEDLHIHLNGGLDTGHGHSDKSVKPYDYSTNIYYGSKGWNESDKYNMSLSLYAQYLKEFNEAHNLDVMAGYEWQHFHYKSDYSYPVYYPKTNNTHPGELVNPDYFETKNSLYKTENYLVSWFGRLNYSLLSRYLFTFTLRNDGSSRFSKDNRWGLFPSAALAWKINDEAFLKDSEVISDAKLRLGWGITGQQEGIGDYMYLPNFTINTAGAYYPISGTGITYRPEGYNPDLTWEKTTTYNVGVDLGFANNRFVASVDYYYRKTKDLLNTVAVAAGTNFSTRIMSNIGSLHNTGIETQLTYRVIQTKDLRWELGYNFTWNKNKIDHLVSTDGKPIGHAYAAIGAGGAGAVMAYAENQPASAFWVYQQVYNQAGQPIEGEFVDRDGDGVLTENDKYFYKKADADVLMGLSSKLIWKKWDFSFSLRASINNYMYNSVEANDRANVSPAYVYSNNTWHNVVEYQLDKNWQYNSNISSQSDYFIQNASFLKCDNITLGYSFNKLAKWNISGRAYATAQNVFTITKYKGIDPEVSGGYDSAIYPRPFTGILGISLNF